MHIRFTFMGRWAVWSSGCQNDVAILTYTGLASMGIWNILIWLVTNSYTRCRELGLHNPNPFCCALSVLGVVWISYCQSINQYILDKKYLWARNIYLCNMMSIENVNFNFLLTDSNITPIPSPQHSVECRLTDRYV